MLDTFPEINDWGQECRAWWASDTEPDDFVAAIESVNEGAERSSLLSRLRETHPPGRQHLDAYDDRLLDVFAEAEAFAWVSEISSLGQPIFVAGEGAPDLRARQHWIEAKQVSKSVEERAETKLLLAEAGDLFPVLRGPQTLR
jgi:hypothetical protein